jgi:two-component system chemotaxis response regulator CheY
MPIRVLVVDDSPAMRTFVSSVLESTGDYDVDEVGHGFEAIRLLPRGGYGLFVFDVNMPDFNGLELIRAVREQPRYARTPLVVMTTEGRLGDVERARAAGAKVVITKPFTRAGLLDAVKQALDAGGPD